MNAVDRRTLAIGPSAASNGGRSAASIAGPVVLVEDVPQPKEYRRPGGSKVGSLRAHPCASTSSVGPPMWVRRTVTTQVSADARAVAWMTAQESAMSATSSHPGSAHVQCERPGNSWYSVSAFDFFFQCL